MVSDTLGKLVAQFESSPWVWASDNSPLQLSDIQHHLPTPESIRRQRNRNCVPLESRSLPERQLSAIEEMQNEFEWQNTSDGNLGLSQKSRNKESGRDWENGICDEVGIGGSWTSKKNVTRSNSSSGGARSSDTARHEPSTNVNEQSPGRGQQMNPSTDHSVGLSESECTLSDLSAFRSSTIRSPAHQTRPLARHSSGGEMRNSSMSSEGRGITRRTENIIRPDNVIRSDHIIKSEQLSETADESVDDCENISLTYTHTDGSPMSNATLSTVTNYSSHNNSRKRRTNRCSSMETSEPFLFRRGRRSQTTSPTVGSLSRVQHHSSVEFGGNSNSHGVEWNGQRLVHPLGEGDDRELLMHKSSEVIIDGCGSLQSSGDQSATRSSTTSDMKEKLPAFPDSFRMGPIHRRNVQLPLLSDNNKPPWDRYNNGGANPSDQFNYCCDVETPTRRTPMSSTPNSSSSYGPPSVSAEVAKWRRICRKEYQESLSNRRRRVSYPPSTSPSGGQMLSERCWENEMAKKHHMNSHCDFVNNRSCGTTPTSSSSSASSLISQTEYQRLMRQIYVVTPSSIDSTGNSDRTNSDKTADGMDCSVRITSASRSGPSSSGSLGLSGDFGTAEQEEHYRQYATPVVIHDNGRRRMRSSKQQVIGKSGALPPVPEGIESDSLQRTPSNRIIDVEEEEGYSGMATKATSYSGINNTGE